jgi:hypothetical protein
MLLLTQVVGEPELVFGHFYTVDPDAGEEYCGHNIVLEQRRCCFITLLLFYPLRS